MGPNHTERLADGDSVPCGNQRTYRLLLDDVKTAAAARRARAAAPAASTWSPAALVALVALAVLAAASIGAGLTSDDQLVRALRLVALVAGAAGMVAALVARKAWTR